MSVLIALFVRLGLSQGLSRILGYVVPVVLAIALLWGAGAALVHHGKAVARSECKAAALAASNAALTRNGSAHDQAAIEQQADTARITNEQEARDDAIKQAPIGGTGAATRAANCIVWRRQHPGAVSAPTGC